MNKFLFLLLSRIKGTKFELKSYIEYNIDFIYHKKVKWTKFLFYIKNRWFIFCSQENEFSTVQIIFLNQGIFPQSKQFYLTKEYFHSQGNFPW